MTKIAQFWLNAASDFKVCARLQADGLPVNLYNFIRESNPKEKGRILKSLDEGLLEAVIELLLKVAAGHSESEKALSLIMLDDIELLAKIRDRAFINKLLLPLIENEITVPVSFIDIQESKLLRPLSKTVIASEG